MLSSNSAPDIRNNSRNKNTGNNSTVLSVRETDGKAENGKRMKMQKTGDGSMKGEKGGKGGKQKWRQEGIWMGEGGEGGWHEVSRYLRQEIERKDKWRKSGEERGERER